MRPAPTALTILALLPATAASAHPGHIAVVAGHDHWVAGAAIGLAVVLGIWGALKGKDADEGARDEDEAEAEGAEA